MSSNRRAPAILIGAALAISAWTVPQASGATGNRALRTRLPAAASLRSSQAGAPRPTAPADAPVAMGIDPAPLPVPARTGSSRLSDVVATSDVARIDALAARNGIDAAHVRAAAADRSLRVDGQDRLYFEDQPPTPPPPGLSDAAGTAGAAATAALPDALEAPFPVFTGTAYDALHLHSRPGAAKTLFIDVDGATIAGTGWNASTGVASQYLPPYDFDGNLAAFSDAEAKWIADVWQAVSEDYAPFDLDVTTEQPTSDRLVRSGAGDSTFGTTIVVTTVKFGCASCGGVAYLNSAGSAYYAPGFAFAIGSFYRSYPQQIAATISHESGHTFGLLHDGVVATPTTSAVEYYSGHGLWYPIMGAAGVWDHPVNQWSRGEYANASQTQDDLAIIAGTTGFVPDDAGNTPASGTVLTANPTATVAKGLINSDADIDWYRVTTGQWISVTVQPTALSPDLDAKLVVYNSGGGVVASADPTGVAAASATATIAPGTYDIAVTGEGYLTASDGYTGYGSLGYYSVSINTVTVPGAVTAISSTPGDHSATVSWAAPAFNGGAPLGYTVSLCPASGSTCSTATTAATSAVIMGLSAPMAYSVAVTADNGTYQSVATGASVSTAAPPGEPRVAVTGTGPYDVSWTAPTTGATVTGYELLIENRTTGAVQSVTPVSSPYHVADAVNPLTITVRALSAAGAGVWSHPVNVGRTAVPDGGGTTVGGRGASPSAPGSGSGVRGPAISAIP